MGCLAWKCLDHRQGWAIWNAYCLTDRTSKSECSAWLQIKRYTFEPVRAGLWKSCTPQSKIANQTGSADPAQAPGGQYKVWAGRINEDTGEALDQRTQDNLYWWTSSQSLQAKNEVFNNPKCLTLLQRARPDRFFLFRAPNLKFCQMWRSWSRSSKTSGTHWIKTQHWRAKQYGAWHGTKPGKAWWAA